MTNYDERNSSSSNDLLLSPNEYAFVKDQATGAVNVIVGIKKSLDPGDAPVIYDKKSRRFDKCSVDAAMQVFTEADESSYVVLKNPAKDSKHPEKGNTSNVVTVLLMGSKVNIPGPVTFPLWPLQVADVIPGHQLKSNQYLVCKVYNEDAARANMSDAVIKKNMDSELHEATDATESLIRATGQLIIIKGMDVSFYIPPTGIEVVPEGESLYVRNAVTLERLEHCILLDESGEKRYVQGPAVVFPEPTEIFEEKNGLKVFRARELNEDMGLHIKVIADYMDGDENFKTGQEIFITGKDQKIYFPRAEHRLIKYGDDYVTYAIAIPKGEARYVLNKRTGEIEKIEGPKMFLPDPRYQVIVKRILDKKTVSLWFPGNAKAMEVNQDYSDRYANTTEEYLSVSDHDTMRGGGELKSRDYEVDSFERKKNFTHPRTISLDTKYDGVVTVSPWTGYAVQVVPKVGERKVVVGPASILMDYDWDLEVLSLSTGKIKSDDHVKRTVYLRIQNNMVSDAIVAITKDDIPVSFNLKYEVDFSGDPNNWFNAENYIALLTDRCRSMLYNMIKTHDVEDFKNNAANFVRNLILGLKDDETGERKNGIDFSHENGMVVTDVTVSPVQIDNQEIGALLNNAQHDVIRDSIELKNLERSLTLSKLKEAAIREKAEIEAATQEMRDGLKKKSVIREAELENVKLSSRQAVQEILDELNDRDLARKKAAADNDHNILSDKFSLENGRIDKETDAFVSKFESIQPQLVAAISTMSERELAGKLAENLPEAAGGLGLLLGKGGVDSLKEMVKGTAIERAINSLDSSKPKVVDVELSKRSNEK